MSIDLLEIDGFLDPGEVAALRAELGTAAGAEATVLSTAPAGVVMPRVRKTTRIAVSPATRERVRQRLLDRRDDIAGHFGAEVGECEEPQFLRYEPGDFFVPHQDGNTSMVYDDSRFRRISLVIFLGKQSDEPAPNTYGGGSLVFHGPYNGPQLRVPVTPAPGKLVAFRAETTHEVTMVTHGERYTIVSWYRANSVSA